MKRKNKVAFAVGATITAIAVGMVLVKRLNEMFKDIDFLGTFCYPDGCGTCDESTKRECDHVDERPSVFRRRRSV